MTSAAALDKFFNEIMTAYPSTAVPSDATYPYMTYENASDYFDNSLSITVQMFFRTESEAIPNAKAEELKKATGRGGTYIEYTGGAIFVAPGSPFCMAMCDEDNSYKRRIFNLEIEYME